MVNDHLADVGDTPEARHEVAKALLKLQACLGRRTE